MWTDKNLKEPRELRKILESQTWACLWIKWSVIWASLLLSSISTSVGSSISFLVISMFASSFCAWNVSSDFFFNGYGGSQD